MLEVTSGWSKIDGRIIRVAGQVAGAFNLDGIDTIDTKLFPAGAGAGSVREITGFAQISQVLELSTSGGEQQFATYSFLENDYDSQIPTTLSAQSVSISIADDPTLPGYQALKAASDAKAVRALKMVLPSGSVLLYNGYVSFNETPTMTKGNVMACKATFSLLSRPVRYAS
ncbi:phage tail protein [Crenobacter cavernae]|uniref:phage tail protein n=1 Tax=Crenobacter cavernae TaxID=2290923 RepID=UPI0023EA708F|nr:phage tail protein [Crenobacter cavernae]